jgi:hypothetical protein
MRWLTILASAAVLCAYTLPAKADTVVANTGNPDGLMAMASRPAGPGLLEIETADDFTLSQATAITGGTFIGLLPSGLPLSSITGVTIELYHVFPTDSANPPDGRVLTRTNSPSDNEFAIHDSASANLTFTAAVLSGNFTAANSVVNGINPLPNQFTGGEGPGSGQEVQFNFSINPESLPAGHYFFVPEVALTNGTFLWLSAPLPIVAPGQPFTPDLQTWIRNSNLAPDWSRVGTDITHKGPFNAAFSLTGIVSAPEPCTFLLTGAGLLGLVLLKRKD